MELHERIKQVSDFLSPDHLSGLALLVVDVQSKFCENKWTGTPETDAVAGRIATLVPEFRKAGVPVYAIYFSHNPEALAGFYKFDPEPTDTLVRKTEMSAFEDTGFDSVLKDDGRKKLLVCGVYLSQCVEATTHDALKKGYDVAVLEDLSEDSYAARYAKPQTLDQMKAEGILITRSQDVLTVLKGGTHDNVCKPA